VIDQPAVLEGQLKAIPGVLDSGIFANVAQCVVVAGASGIRKIEKMGM